MARKHGHVLAGMALLDLRVLHVVLKANKRRLASGYLLALASLTSWDLRGNFNFLPSCSYVWDQHIISWVSPKALGHLSISLLCSNLGSSELHYTVAAVLHGYTMFVMPDENALHKCKPQDWTKEEINMLTNNIELYMKEHGIDNPTEIIFKMSQGERKDFYRSISLGLNRPWFSIHRRVIQVYDDRNHVGKYRPEEIEKLKGLWQKHGNDWITIGTAMGRSPSSVKDRCRLMKDTCNTGKWTEEEPILGDVVHELTCTEVDEKVTHGVCWATVAQRVGTRSAKQCRAKWLNYLNWKQTGGIEWTRKDEVTLIQRLAELDVSDESEIRWDELAKGWESVRSQWLQSKRWVFKRQITNHKNFAFPVLVRCHQQEYESQNASLRFWKNTTGSEISGSNPDISAQQVPFEVTSIEDNNTSVCPVPMTGWQISFQHVPRPSADLPAAVVNSEIINLHPGSQ
ncbi:cyclin-D-binding Myb-like transcription factor 1 [Mus caroli]|uniref:Cyclin-D-binding Myb-like transcription factor 1 n=1 Tax=Mus caroli TaxID=10089 RepID=A0A6P5P3H3_MUSCR|nr:cyclin-D-binding Myb-like transcription factor 1 [Mus caroli]